MKYGLMNYRVFELPSVRLFALHIDTMATKTKVMILLCAAYLRYTIKLISNIRLSWPWITHISSMSFFFFIFGCGESFHKRYFLFLAPTVRNLRLPSPVKLPEIVLSIVIFSSFHRINPQLDGRIRCQMMCDYLWSCRNTPLYIWISRHFLEIQQKLL